MEFAQSNRARHEKNRRTMNVSRGVWSGDLQIRKLTCRRCIAMFIRRIFVGDRNRALVVQAGRFQSILMPGKYWFWTFGRSTEFESYDLKTVVFESPWADYLAGERKDVADRYFTTVETSDAQVAVVYLDGKLARVI